MKKVLLAAFVLATVSASAQKNSLLVGGDVNLSTAKVPSTPNDQKGTEFTFAPTIGYQFNDNWTAGVVAKVSSNKYTNNNNVVDKSSEFAIGPFVRYTKTLSNIFSIYGQAQAAFGSSKSNGTKTGASTDVNLFPAVFVNVKNGFGLNFAFGGIGYSSSKPTGGKSSSGFNVDFGKTMNIGISKNFSFGKKKK